MLMQQHIGPNHVHAVAANGARLKTLTKPTQRPPPRRIRSGLDPVGLARSFSIQISLCVRISFLQQGQCVQSRANGIPADPRIGLQTNEGQSFCHATRHFFMQPRRLGRQRLVGDVPWHVRPSACGNGIQAWRTFVGHANEIDGVEVAEYIDS